MSEKRELLLRLDSKIYDELQYLSEEKDRSLSYIIREACANYVSSTVLDTNQAEEALIWIETQFHFDWYEGLDPEKLQNIITSIAPLVRRLYADRKGTDWHKPRCQAEHDLWGRCFVEEGYHDYHYVFQNGSKCLWRDKCCGEGEACNRDLCTGYPRMANSEDV